MVFPELYVCVRLFFIFIKEAERSAALCCGKYGTSCKVDTDTNNVLSINTALLDNIGDCDAKNVYVILRMLKCPVLTELFAARKLLIHNCVRILVNTACKLLACFNIDNKCTTRKCAVIKTYSILCHFLSAFLLYNIF